VVAPVYVHCFTVGPVVSDEKMLVSESGDLAVVVALLEHYLGHGLSKPD
jgi:hypothetical protein